MATHRPGDPCWVELSTPDTDAAVGFYGRLFGWEATAPDEAHGGYRQFLLRGVPVAGLLTNEGSVGPDTWSVYLSSDDAATTTARVTEHGGQVVVEPMQVGDLGHMAFVVDPAGAAVGVWQPLSFAGTQVLGEVGAPAWFETLSTDYAASVAFYRDAFCWDSRTMSDTAEFRYTTLGEGEDARAGIMDAAGFLGGSGSRWQFYVEVPDTDETVERAVAAGGALTQPAEDTPYGRLAALADPAGVAVCLLGPNRA